MNEPNKQSEQKRTSVPPAPFQDLKLVAQCAILANPKIALAEDEGPKEGLIRKIEKFLFYLEIRKERIEQIRQQHPEWGEMKPFMKIFMDMEEGRQYFNVKLGGYSGKCKTAEKFDRKISTFYEELKKDGRLLKKLDHDRPDLAIWLPFRMKNNSRLVARWLLDLYVDWFRKKKKLKLPSREIGKNAFMHLSDPPNQYDEAREYLLAKESK